MVDKKTPELPLDTDDSHERALWNALGKHEAGEPSAALRREFYRKLEAASRPSVLERLQELLGFRGNAGWLTATACLIIGLGGGAIVASGSGTDDERLAVLEENIALLNRNLILDRLENEAPSKRLRGVIDAASVAGNDAEVAHALLVRATQDRVGTVRSAAIDALGPNINAPTVGEQLMPLLQQAQSPIVQLALIDLVLRYGNKTQMDEVLALAKRGKLHPDLERYVITTLEGEIA